MKYIVRCPCSSSKFLYTDTEPTYQCMCKGCLRLYDINADGSITMLDDDFSDKIRQERTEHIYLSNWLPFVPNEWRPAMRERKESILDLAVCE